MADAGLDVGRTRIVPTAKSAATVSVAALLATLLDRLEVALMSTNVRANPAILQLSVSTLRDPSVAPVAKVPSAMATPKAASLLTNAKRALDAPTNWLVSSVKEDPKLAPILALQPLAVPMPSAPSSITSRRAPARRRLEEIPTTPNSAASASTVSRTKIVHKTGHATSNPSNVSILAIRWNATTDSAK